MENDFFEDKKDDTIKAERDSSGRFTSGNTSGKKRGRPKKEDKLEKELREKKQAELEKQEKFEGFRNPVRTGLKIILNDSIINRIPAEANVKPLDDMELDALTSALIPVLDELGWLDVSGNPYLNLAITGFALGFPRMQAFMIYKRGKNEYSRKRTRANESGDKRETRVRENDESEKSNQAN